MLIVRDRHTGRAVSWGTDHHRMHEIANGDPNLYVVEDLTASAYYWCVKRPTMSASWVHPYDADAQREADVKP